MSIAVADNFHYKGGKPLDARVKYSTVSEMVAVSAADLYDGCLAYVTATKNYYTYDSSNTVDATLGKWRKTAAAKDSTNAVTQNSTDLIESGAVYTGLSGKVDTSSVGTANGVAELDATGKVPSSQLPSYVDDVVDGYYKEADGKFYEESTYETEITGETGKIYISVDTDIQYRWTGSAFSALGGALVLGETSSTAYRGDRGKTAYDFSQNPATANPLMDGTAAVGSSGKWAKEDHVHPSDTSKADASTVTGILDGQTIDSFADVETALADKADKVSGATNGNFAGLDANGNLTDSGKSADDFLGQFSTMPTASSSNEGKIVQFVGTTGTYTNGYFYECVSDGETPATYSWVAKSVQSGGGTGGHTIEDNGTAMTDRAALNFIGFDVSDDSTNDETEVSEHELTAEELAELTLPGVPVELPSYSTQEQVVATWIDGKPLYQKTLDIQNPAKSTPIVVGIQNVSFAMKHSVWFEISNGSDTRYTNPFCNGNDYMDCTIYDSDSNVLTLQLFMGANTWAGYSVTHMYVTLLYTKTTD